LFPGDSGHGVLVKHQGLFYLRGIVSSTIIDRQTGTCTISKFAVITNVLLYKTWIQNPTENYQAINQANQIPSK
jgi:hypothetical protein